RGVRIGKGQRTLRGDAGEVCLLEGGQAFLRAGILMKRLGRPARACRAFAAARVLAVSWARTGETSRDTHPSTPCVLCQIGRKRSAARVTSSIARSKKRSSPDRPSLAFFRIAAS